MSAVIPRATYRLQFNRDFTFTDATRLVPYLHDLGISHCYASPLLKARTGSSHGYDIVDHNALNPELGSTADFHRFTATLAAHGMGLILDLVPNHMGIGSDNAWWLDVLEHGPASPFADYFDIDWQPVAGILRGKVLLPILGDHYGRVLDGGEITLAFDGERGVFSAHYYDHLLPIDPQTYPLLLQHAVAGLGNDADTAQAVVEELEQVSKSLARLPRRRETEPRYRRRRQEQSRAGKERLAALCHRGSEARRAIDAAVKLFNNADASARGYDALHKLLEKQAYRLAFWRVAADEINYRRFFNINSLAGIRVESDEVFGATHRLLLELVASGSLAGLRIDHPDGLHDPPGYCHRLNAAIHKVQSGLALGHGRGACSVAPPLYLVVEKILAPYEHLPEDWPVHGTTGYDFAALVNGLFIPQGNEAALSRTYRRFTGQSPDLIDDLIYQSKKLISKVQLSSELTVLANLLKQIAELDRHTRDFTFNGLREALIEVVASFPVYRTYIATGRVSSEDKKFVDWAVAQAKKRSQAADISIFDFVRHTLLRTGEEGGRRRAGRVAGRFAMKFQQYTAPVMAKGVEDTAFYIANRLVSMNEVGADPRRFGVSPAAFHRANQERLRRWPHTMLATSTHDTKRSEDVRARINVLAELPEEWRQRLVRWSRMNRRHKRLVNDRLAPSRNDEYLLYQTLFGTWPLRPPDEAEQQRYRERIESFLLKAVKEAKTNTSWINPDPEYEAAVTGFTRALLAGGEANPFLVDFLPFVQQFYRPGLLSSLSQTLLKLTAPGVADIYQGNELWDFSLVDPDNRRPVDYPHRQRLLQAIRSEFGPGPDLPARLTSLIEHLDDGRAKLYLIWKTLGFRQENDALFAEGDYLPLEVAGERAAHLCAFGRRFGGQGVVVAAPRLLARLLAGAGEKASPLGTAIWQDTRIALPPQEEFLVYRNILTNELHRPWSEHNEPRLAASRLFSCFPFALLVPVAAPDHLA